MSQTDPPNDTIFKTSRMFTRRTIALAAGFSLALGSLAAHAALLISADKALATDIFIRVQKSKLAPDLVQRIIDDPENDVTVRTARLLNLGTLTE
ncbi:hypothetical protein ACSFA3_05770 [Variovorax sp. RHLX14]|uniref:hypothetical protein n=1 Tax=Variovorax sp. RHLX14 TaxID=1259731 RepID=UPI003F456271